jgi:hypothetical protein
MNTEHDQNRLEPKLEERFARLREIPPRSPERAAEGRAAFLSQARELAQKNPRSLPVSAAPPQRLIEWIRTISETFTRKEKQPMFTKIMAVLIAAALVFSGAAVTAYASQASLPTDALYGVKTFGENLRLSMAFQSGDKLGLALEFTQRRIDEMKALSDLGIKVPEHLAAQYQEQVEFALRLGAGLSDDKITPALEQIRSRLQEQLQIMEQLQQVSPDDAVLARIRERLQEQLRLVELGLRDPQQFREQLRLREQIRQQTQQPTATQEPGATATPGAGNQNGNANDDNGNGNGNMNGNANDGNGNGNTNGNANDDDDNGNGNMNGNGNDDDDDDNGNGNMNGNGNDDDDDDNGNGNMNGNGNGNDNDDDNGNGNGNDNDDDQGGNGNGNDDDDNGGNGNGNG